MQLIDTHTHLDFPDFDADRAQLLAGMCQRIGDDAVHHVHAVERAFAGPAGAGKVILVPHPQARGRDAQHADA